MDELDKYIQEHKERDKNAIHFYEEMIKDSEKAELQTREEMKILKEECNRTKVTGIVLGILCPISIPLFVKKHDDLDWKFRRCKDLNNECKSKINEYNQDIEYHKKRIKLFEDTAKMVKDKVPLEEAIAKINSFNERC